MGEPREDARRWLADVIRRIPGADEMWDNAPNDIAEAILNAPGVEVEEAGVVVDWDSSHPVMVRKRVIVKLPWGGPIREPVADREATERAREAP